MLSALELSTAVLELAGSSAQRAYSSARRLIRASMSSTLPLQASASISFAISESPIAPSCALLDLGVCASRLNTSKFPCSSVRQIWEET